MRIDPSQAAHISALTPRAPRQAQPTQESGQAYRPDSANLTERARDVRRAEAAAASASDVRADRVAAIKSLVQSGTYKVDNQQLAEKLMNVL